MMMTHRMMAFVLTGIVAFILSLPSLAQPLPDKSLKVVIIRHGEKPETGDNLSCQGENRALQLPAVLHRKFNKPDYTYVPSLELSESTQHARMLQTVTPLAIKDNLTVNSQFGEKEYSTVAADVQKKGSVALIFESTTHSGCS